MCLLVHISHLAIFRSLGPFWTQKPNFPILGQTYSHILIIHTEHIYILILTIGVSIDTVLCFTIPWPWPWPWPYYTLSRYHNTYSLLSYLLTPSELEDTSDAAHTWCILLCYCSQYYLVFDHSCQHACSYNILSLNTHISTLCAVCVCRVAMMQV